MSVPPPVVITGRPPNPGETQLVAASEEFAPAKSLTRVQESAKVILTNVTVAGALLAALGTIAGDRLAKGDWWIWAPAAAALALTAISVGLAAWALVPRVDEIASGDLNAVGAWYQNQIKVRGGKVRLAGVLFAVALAAAALPALLLLADIGTDEEKADPGISMSWAGTSTDAKFTLKVAAESLPDGATAATKLLGNGTTTLLNATSVASSEGKLDVSTEVPNAATYSNYIVKVTIRNKEGKQLRRESLTFNPP
jgi:hypothetical protein